MRALRTGRVARAAMAVGAAAALMACAPPPDGEGPATDRETGTGTVRATAMAEGGLRVTLSAGPARAGAPIDVSLEVANPGEGEAVLDFPDGQRFDFEVLRGDETVWRWAADMFFPQMLGRERIPPGESIEWSARLEAGLPSGDYRVRGILTTRPRVAVEATLPVSPATGDPTR